MNAQTTTDHQSLGGLESRDHHIKTLLKLNTSLNEVMRELPIKSHNDVDAVVYLTYAIEWIDRAVSSIKQEKGVQQ